MTRNLFLILTTSALALALVQHSAHAGAPHGFKAGGSASAPVRNDRAAPTTGATSRPGKPDVAFRAADRQAVQPSSTRPAGDAMARPVVQPPARNAAFTARAEAPVHVLPQGPADVRREARAPQAADGAPRLSGPAERTLLRPDHSGAIEQSAMNRYVALNDAAGNTTTVTPAIGRDRFESMLGRINNGIRTGEYRLAPLTGGNPPEGTAGNARTIVIGQNENGKTVYVPASRLSGPDKRTIDVNCNDCKVVIVGDKARGGGSVEDDRRIVVNGNGDKVVTQGDRANGGAGRDGGTVTDDRRITVNGNKDAVKAGGDRANGRDTLFGRNGGDGGTVDDNRRVVINGNKDKVGFGTSSADGGNGGFGLPGGRNGGDGGAVNDNSRVVVNGNRDKVSLGTNSADGGKGGNGLIGGGNGGAGGAITDHGRVNDNGSNTGVTPGADRANGGNGGDGLFGLFR